ncbi:sigma factor-like helix-turn-helix DNA-binding protein [Gemmatimonas sp.]|uniref:sigma factor-like helix-turn-helix DNA-binding protein n=1 Tax=Gemmatimonas sp. TaxID=1962908 RepID=UPI003DA4085D
MKHRQNKTTDTGFVTAAALHLLVTTAGTLFMLLLLVRTANASVARAATTAFRMKLRQRVAELVAAFAPGRFVVRDTAARIEEIASAIEAALPACRSRSPRDLDQWIAIRVRDAIDGDPVPPAPRQREMVTDSEQTLGLLAAPRGERLAVLHAVLQRLTAAERAVLNARLRPRATWGTVAAALGVSETTARQRYARVVERAQLLIVGLLAERIDRLGEDDLLPLAA